MTTRRKAPTRKRDTTTLQSAPQVRQYRVCKKGRRVSRPRNDDDNEAAVEDVSFLPSFFPPLLEAFLGKVVLPSFEKERTQVGRLKQEAGGREGDSPRPIDGSEGKGEREGERERERERPQDLLFWGKRARDSVASFFHLTARPSFPPSS